MGSYGGSALSASITMPNFDAYLQKIQDAGNNVDEVCKAAVNAALPIVQKAAKEGAERHRKTGDVSNAIEVQEAKIEGNLIVGTFGIDMEKHPEAKHAVYQEYGDGHSPEFPDPFMRPAVDDNKSKILKVERDILKEGGIPIE